MIPKRISACLRLCATAFDMHLCELSPAFETNLLTR